MNGKKTNKKNTLPVEPGSALILTVGLIMLLVLVGVLFVSSARLDNMTSSSTLRQHWFEAALDTVISQIDTCLISDIQKYPSYDCPDDKHPWLADIEPVFVSDNGTPANPTDDNYQWRNISSLDNTTFAPLTPQIIPDSLDAVATQPADADGDGVADARWIKLPNVTTDKGKQVFAAVRIIDNCAMLNLNTAHTLAPDSDGRYLSEVDYTQFLRAYDARHSARLQVARDISSVAGNVEAYHNNVVMRIENPNAGLPVQPYSLFDIGDELEIRNRYLLTSPAIARFEKRDINEQANKNADPPVYTGVAYQTFDLGRGSFGFDPWAGFWPARVKGVPFDNIAEWNNKFNHANFDDTDPANTHAFEYDRRHICTFYSFDRYSPNLIFDADISGRPDAIRAIFLPKGPATTNIQSPLDEQKYNNITTRAKIVHLLYALRAYFMSPPHSLGPNAAARRSAQIVANIIDYSDDPASATEGPFYYQNIYGQDVYGRQQNNAYPTYINREIIRQLILEVSRAVLEPLNLPEKQIDINSQSEYEFGLVKTNPFNPSDTSDTVYGYERQPFIAEVYSNIDNDVVVYDKILKINISGILSFAVELVNPYPDKLKLDGWQLVIDPSDSSAVIPLDNLEIDDKTTNGTLGRLVLYAYPDDPNKIGLPPPIEPGTTTYRENALLTIKGTGVIELQRPVPATSGKNFITVDRVKNDIIAQMFLDSTDKGSTLHSYKRDDREWRFIDAGAYITATSADPTTPVSPALGKSKNLTLDLANFQLAVPDNQGKPVATLIDLETMSLWSSQSAGDPNCITETIAKVKTAASPDLSLYFDVQKTPELFGYISLINRPVQGTLPGRININTANEFVIRAAIPESSGGLWDTPDTIAKKIVQLRRDDSLTPTVPYESLHDLLKVADWPRFDTDPNNKVGSPLAGADIEERDWLLSSVANKLTTRSDVFTAYIAIRLGKEQADPLKRWIVIFDRTGVYNSSDKPAHVAVHPVPDPR